PYLNAKHVESIDAILISHPHLDHYGGTAAILGEFKVSELIDAGTPTVAPPYLKLMKILELRKVGYRTVKAGDRLDWDPGLQVQVLWPPKEIIEKKRKKSKNLNDQSIVLKVTHGQNTFLFPGDVEKRAEKDVVDDWGHE